MQSMTVPASMKYLCQVMDFTCELLEKAGCGDDDARLIKISVEELFTNIASYAYDRKDGQVRMQWDIRRLGENQKEIVIGFWDEGTPYNPFAREDPDLFLPIEERPVGGLGIYMTKKFMDRVEYRCEEGRNITVIAKRFRTDGQTDRRTK